MKKFFGNIQTLTIIVLVLLIILMRMCQGPKPVPDKPKITIVETVKYDTITKQIPKYIPVPGPIKHDTTYLDRDIDTTAILKDYFATYFYNDTIDRDTVKIYISDQITENKIASRNIKYDIIYPTKTVTIREEHYINQREFYIGPRIEGIVSGDLGLAFIGVESVFRSKKRKTFSIAAGVNQNFAIQVGLGLHWKLTK
jgi:hypothetical protein